MENKTELTKEQKFFTTLLYTIVVCIQPILWWVIYHLCESKDTGFGLGFVCALSCILFAFGSIYISEYIIEGKNPLED